MVSLVYHFRPAAEPYLNPELIWNHSYLLLWDFFILNSSVALVRERAIPTERPPLVEEGSANFCG
jgi:hypothetical protein